MDDIHPLVDIVMIILLLIIKAIISNAKSAIGNVNESIVKKDISRVSIVGNGIIRNYSFIKEVLDIIQKNKLELLEFNVSESKISIDFKGIIEDNFLNEMHSKIINI